jgi:hypothetical protein
MLALPPGWGSVRCAHFRPDIERILCINAKSVDACLRWPPRWDTKVRQEHVLGSEMPQVSA